MVDAPLGHVVNTVLAAAFVWAGLRPRPTRGPRVTPSFVLGTVSSELHLLMLVMVGLPILVAGLEGDLASRTGRVTTVLAALTLLGILVQLVRAWRAAPAVESALRAQLGPEVRVRRCPAGGQRLRVLLAPVRWLPRDVVRVRDVRYGPAPGKANLLDVYRPRARREPGWVLLHLHGGGFASGGKSREARLLLERLAGRGWVCVSANYRLRPARFPDQLVDAKRVIAWLRTHGHEYGAEASVVLVVGGSAGAHLAMMCALTGNDPRLQPGFEDADTRVAGAVGLYGYYGPAGVGAASSPAAHVRPDTPPVMLVHGELDPMVPAGQARAFAADLRAVSREPVIWAELPGGLHVFDRFASLRSAAVVAGVEAFAGWLTGGGRESGPPPRRPGR